MDGAPPVQVTHHQRGAGEAAADSGRQEAPFRARVTPAACGRAQLHPGDKSGATCGQPSLPRSHPPSAGNLTPAHTPALCGARQGPDPAAEAGALCTGRSHPPGRGSPSFQGPEKGSRSAPSSSASATGGQRTTATPPGGAGALLCPLGRGERGRVVPRPRGNGHHSRENNRCARVPETRVPDADLQAHIIDGPWQQEEGLPGPGRGQRSGADPSRGARGAGPRGAGRE